MTNQSKREYQNAGSQTAQGRVEAVNFWKQHDDHFVPLKTVSIVLGIRLQKVGELPLERRKIDKRWYCRKGDVQALLAAELNKPDSILNRLRAEHAKTMDRMQSQPSRQYKPGTISKAEGRSAKEKTKTNRLKEPDSYEAWCYPRSVERVKALKAKNKS